MLWPLPLHMRQHVIGWLGDNVSFVWLIGWFDHALIDLHQMPFSVPTLNYPAGYHLAYTDPAPLMITLALPFNFLSGPVLGYNGAIVISFVLSGLGMYLWVYAHTYHRGVSLLMGAIFAFVPYRMTHLYGHLNLMGTQWFPLFFWSVDRLLDAQRPTWRQIYLAAFFLGCIAFTSLYYLYMALLIGAVYAAVTLWQRRRLFDRARWLRLFWAAGLMLLPVGLAIVPSLLVLGGNRIQHTLESVLIWSASPTDYLLPSPRHFLWGQWVETNFDRRLWIATTLYLGGVMLVFTAVTVWTRRRFRHTTAPVAASLWAMGTAFVLSLGPVLHWLGRPVTISTPVWAQGWHPSPEMWIPLPGYALFEILPFYASMRDWTRYGILVALFGCLLAGIGINFVSQQIPRRYVSALLGGLLVVGMVEFYSGSMPITELAPRPVDLWLQAQPETGAVAHFPFWQAKYPPLSYATSIHHKPYIGDPFGTFDTPQFQRIQPILNSFPDPASIDLLRELGVRWVVVDAAPYPDFAQIQAQLASANLYPAATFNTYSIYILD